MVTGGARPGRVRWGPAVGRSWTDGEVRSWTSDEERGWTGERDGDGDKGGAGPR
jgi:hypothetical protein